ncbi:hypothetical protein CR513_25125, partial [Mucuna pruriens]
MAAEFVACFETSNQGTIENNCDNNSTISYSNNNRNSTKSKFIDIKFLVVKERYQNKRISIKHIGINFILADPLTKGLIPKIFHEYTAHM